jgi:HrpA-like RNA helicase
MKQRTGEPREVRNRHAEQLRGRILEQNLPVQERREEVTAFLKNIIQNGGVGILTGETGSGKSVISPLAMEDALTELGHQGQIVMSQPRKDATRLVGQAIAAVRDGKPAGTRADVGYSSSEDREAGRANKIHVMTAGILVRRLAEGTISPQEVSAIILDEVHMNTVEMEEILGYLKILRSNDACPPILCTSATANTQELQAFFGIVDDHCIAIEGRTHPVETHFLDAPIEGHRVYEQCAELVTQAYEHTPGDVLVFLPGLREMEEVRNRISHIDADVLFLHSSYGAQDRDTILRGHASGERRRIILSTNIAETSVTVPGVTAVVDSTLERFSSVSQYTGVKELGTRAISQAQMQQRAGRAGRIEAGHYFTPLTQEQYTARQEHPTPAMEDAHIPSIVLRLRAGGHDVRDFPFLHAPDPDTVAAAERDLKMLGAINEQGITEVGQEMAEMYMDPRYARLLIEAKKMSTESPEHTARLQALACSMIAVLRNKPIVRRPDVRGLSQPEKIARRNEQHEKHQKIALRPEDPTDSDHLLHLRLLARSIQNGGWETSLSGRGRRAYNQYCNAHALDARTIQHVIANIVRIAGAMDIRFDQHAVQNSLSGVGPQHVSRLLLAAYPDKLFANNLFGLELVGANASRVGRPVFSPGSVALRAGEAPLYVASHMQASEKTQRTYVEGAHPITLSDFNHFPDRIDGFPDIADLRETAQGVAVKASVIFSGPHGIMIGHRDHEKLSGTLTGELAVRATLQYALQEVRRVVQDDSRLREADTLQILSRERIKHSDGHLREWVASQLPEEPRVADVENLLRFPVPTNVLIDEHALARARETFPEKVTIDGVTLQVDYSGTDMVPEVRLPPEDLMRLQRRQFQLPKATAVRFRVEGYFTDYEIIRLQKRVIEDTWNQLVEKQKSTYPARRQSIEKMPPTCDDFGATDISITNPYALDHNTKRLHPYVTVTVDNGDLLYAIDYTDDLSTLQRQQDALPQTVEDIRQRTARREQQGEQRKKASALLGRLRALTEHPEFNVYQDSLGRSAERKLNIVLRDSFSSPSYNDELIASAEELIESIERECSRVERLREEVQQDIAVFREALGEQSENEQGEIASIRHAFHLVDQQSRSRQLSPFEVSDALKVLQDRLTLWQENTLWSTLVERPSIEGSEMLTEESREQLRTEIGLVDLVLTAFDDVSFRPTAARPQRRFDKRIADAQAALQTARRQLDAGIINQHVLSPIGMARKHIDALATSAAIDEDRMHRIEQLWFSARAIAANAIADDSELREYVTEGLTSESAIRDGLRRQLAVHARAYITGEELPSNNELMTQVTNDL